MSVGNLEKNGSVNGCNCTYCDATRSVAEPVRYCEATPTFRIDWREFRAVIFLDSGQRFEGWLPAGTYVILGECTLEGIDAVKLSRGREDWYVGRVAFECRADRPLSNSGQ